MRVKHHNRVNPEFAAAAADFKVAVNRVLARAFARALDLAQVHRRYVGDFGGQCEFAHIQTPQCGMWWLPSDTATFFGSQNTS